MIAGFNYYVNKRKIAIEMKGHKSKLKHNVIVFLTDGTFNPH